ncbi:hypothetical protein HDU90_008583 [Geranomyces variabilis]|nr:hypothetical protein HDU90_008583 [Geranomyces variabilis]
MSGANVSLSIAGNAASASTRHATTPPGPNKLLSISWRPWDIVEHRDITYATPEELKQAGPGAEKYMQLDLLRRGSAVRKRPVYIYYHGGAWTIGDKRLPVNPICWEMASRGWIVINVNYRMAPRSRYPEILIDCKRALRWVKENVAKYGGDPDFVAVGGGSAGGHLAAMLALTPNRKDFQPGFESTDTRISAALLSYPVVDVTNASGYALPGFPFWFAHKICGLPHSPSPTPWLLKNACPLAAIPSAAAEARRKNGDDHPSIPPTMVVHGANDNVVGKGTVRCFVDSLRGVDGVDVAYLEVPGAHHGFDCFSGAKTTLVHWAGGEFLDAMWARSRCRA